MSRTGNPARSKTLTGIRFQQSAILSCRQSNAGYGGNRFQNLSQLESKRARELDLKQTRERNDCWNYRPDRLPSAKINPDFGDVRSKYLTVSRKFEPSREGAGAINSGNASNPDRQLPSTYPYRKCGIATQYSLWKPNDWTLHCARGRNPQDSCTFLHVSVAMNLRARQGGYSLRNGKGIEGGKSIHTLSTPECGSRFLTMNQDAETGEADTGEHKVQKQWDSILAVPGRVALVVALGGEIVCK